MTVNLTSNQFAVASVPTTYFGSGSVEKLPELLNDISCDCVLVITDKGLAKTPVVANVLDQLESRGITSEVFAGIQPNPTTDNVDSGADIAATLVRGAGRVAVVAVGGGSAIDAAKAIALAAVNPERGRDLDYLGSFANPALPLIAIPTTAGTGAECNSFGVITDTETQRKFYVGGPLPIAALLDPKLTLSLPPGPTAASGMDALTHSLESIMSVNANPRSEGIALQAIRIITANLPRAVAKGQDLEARTQMLLAAHMSAEAMATTGLGLCHAIGHALGGRFDIPHGVALTMVLPGVVLFNLPVSKERLVDVDMDAILAMPAQIGMTKRLSEFGVTAKDFDAITTDALEDNVIANTPRMPTRSQIADILAGAL